MPVFESPGLSGGECSVVSGKFGEIANRESVKGSIVAAPLPVLSCLPNTRGAASMLTFRLEMLDDVDGCCGCCCCCDCKPGADETKDDDCLGDVGEAALLLRDCGMGVDDDLVGDAGRGAADRTGSRRELLAFERETVSLEPDDSADAETDDGAFVLDDVSGSPLAKKNLGGDAESKLGPVVDMAVELEGGLRLRPLSAVAPFAYKKALLPAF